MRDTSFILLKNVQHNVSNLFSFFNDLQTETLTFFSNPIPTPTIVTPIRLAVVVFVFRVVEGIFSNFSKK